MNRLIRTLITSGLLAGSLFGSLHAHASLGDATSAPASPSQAVTSGDLADFQRALDGYYQAKDDANAEAAERFQWQIRGWLRNHEKGAQVQRADYKSASSKQFETLLDQFQKKHPASTKAAGVYGAFRRSVQAAAFGAMFFNFAGGTGPVEDRDLVGIEKLEPEHAAFVGHGIMTP